MGMNIAVIAGGTSTERDVSLSSGKLICASLRRNGHNANMIDVLEVINMIMYRISLMIRMI